MFILFDGEWLEVDSVEISRGKKVSLLTKGLRIFPHQMGRIEDVRFAHRISV